MRKSVCREEVLAYTEAVTRLRDQDRFIQSKRSRGIIPAPELDMVTPNQRVEHYMSKLRDYLLVDEDKKQIFNEAARIIQSHVRHFLWRKTLLSVKSRISTMELPPSTTLTSETLTKEQRNSIRKPRQSWSRKRSTVAMIPVYARAYRGSVLNFARQVSGTGLNQELEPRQSIHMKQLDNQIAEVAPVLHHMMSTRPERRTGSCSSTCFENPDARPSIPDIKPPVPAPDNSAQNMRQEMDTLHDKMDQIVESLGLLAREIAEAKTAMMYSTPYSGSSPFSRL